MRIEEDQEKAVEVPPEAPGWAQAVEVVANLESKSCRCATFFPTSTSPW